MADEYHFAKLKEGVKAWNEWRNEALQGKIDLRNANLAGVNLCGIYLREADLEGADLRGANLREAILSGASLSGANLSEANLSGADLREADLSEVDLTKADLRETNLRKASLRKAILPGAFLSKAGLSKADLREADLQRTYLNEASLLDANLSGASLDGADLWRADLSGTNLSNASLQNANLMRVDLSSANLCTANLKGANLQEAILVETKLDQANLSGCQVYGISAWGLKGVPTAQANLVITPNGEAEITVDDLQVAQFIYLLLDNHNVRNVIDTITSKAVLILGCFTDERKAILDALRDELRKRNYLPVLFDFAGPKNRNLTETVSTLAHIARFVIADITDARSIAQELAMIVPHLPNVPVQPIILASQQEYAMFEHFKHFPWVMPLYKYEDIDQIISSLPADIVTPLETTLKKKVISGG